MYFNNKKTFQWDAYRPFSDSREGGLPTETPLDRDPLDRDPRKEHGTRDRDPPRKDIAPDRKTGSNIIQRPPLP